MYVSLAALCIPVLVQPMVQSAYADMLPYAEFSLSYSLHDLERLPELLRAVPPERKCALRANAAKYFRLLMWQQPHGLAYDILMLSLCRRALRLANAGKLRVSTRSWEACAHTTAEELLAAVPA